MITSDHNPIDIEHKKMELIWLKRNNRIRKCVWRLDDGFASGKVIDSRKKQFFQIEKRCKGKPYFIIKGDGILCYFIKVKKLCILGQKNNRKSVWRNQPRTINFSIKMNKKTIDEGKTAAITIYIRNRSFYICQ
jgi:hypothetical protein